MVMMFFSFVGYVEADAFSDEDFVPKLSAKNLTLEVGERTILDSKWYIGGSDGDWKSSNTKVATVSRWRGYVIAKKVGTSKITLTEGGKTYTCKLKVVPQKKKNAKEVKALKKLIKKINAKGGKLPTNINAKRKSTKEKVYSWHNGHLVEMNVAGFGKANVDVSLCAFKQLKSVNMIDVKSLNISKCKKLEYIRVSVKKRIDFSKCKKLKSIVLDASKKDKRWKKIDLSKNVELLRFDMDEIYPSNISKIKFGKCKKLELINVYGCEKMKTLDLNGCKNLRFLDAGSDNLTSIKYDKCKKLEEVGISSKKIERLTFRNCKGLRDIKAKIGELQLDGCDKVENLTLSNPNNKSRKLDKLTIKNCKYSTEFKGILKAKQVTISNCSKLERLARLNGAQDVNISKCPLVRGVSCSGGSLTKLSIRDCLNLEQIDCSNNVLTSLDLSGLPNLKELYCSDNQLTNLDLSKNTALESLDCSNNKLTNLDLSKNVALKTLNCCINQLTSLDLTNLSCLQKVVVDSNVTVIGCRDEIINKK